jgi:hypothetical protein
MAPRPLMSVPERPIAVSRPGIDCRHELEFDRESSLACRWPACLDKVSVIRCNGRIPQSLTNVAMRKILNLSDEI